VQVCLIPMKPLAGAKARLASVLAPEERRTLSLAMLADVVAAARGFDRIWVLNSDADAADVARSGGAVAVPDPAPGGGLNASVDLATASAMNEGAAGVLVVAADVPAARADDLAAVAAGAGVSLAPDAGGSGTNALWRSPGDTIAAAFGAGSRAAHESLALGSGVPFHIVENARLAADVDTPEGLAAAWNLGAGEATRRALVEMGLPARLRPAG